MIERQSINTKSMVIPFPLNFDNDKYLEMYKSFNKIMTLARDLNTQIDTPEFIFLGKDGSGKSLLIESLIGLPLGIAGTTFRPIHITMISNLNYEKPIITVKRDRFLNGFEIDRVIELAEITLEVTKRNAKTSIPIQIQIEYKYCLSMTLIEPPSLSSFKLNSISSSTSAGLEEQLQINFSKSSDDHKMLVFLTNSSNLEDYNDMVDLAKKLDHKLDRSIFVLNHFNEHLPSFSNSKDLNKYLTDLTKGSNTFYLSLPDKEQRLQCKKKEQLKNLIEQLSKRDSDTVEQLQYDKKFGHNIGIQSFTHHVSEVTWKRYQEVIPEVLKRLRSFKKNSNEQLYRLKLQISNLEGGNLRVVASDYVMEFLQNIDKLIVGTLEGNPALNGQTLGEEKSQDDTGEWLDHNLRILDNPSKRVLYHDSKLYGGQQFERALSEFKNISEVIELGDLAADEIATALGTNRPGNVSALAWAASDIAQKKSKELLAPLIEQLFRRQGYILRRLADIVDKMIENKKKVAVRRQNSSPLSFESSSSSNGKGSGNEKDNNSKQNGGNASDLINVEDHPYFIFAIKEMYFRFINQVAEVCQAKCMDEFYTTRLIHWELNNNKDLKKISDSSPKSPNETMSIVAGLASKLFQDIRNRITKNVMLKCYDFFLIPMQNDLRKEIQGKITILSDKILDELFEVPITKERLVNDEKHLSQITNQFQQQEENFLLASNLFSYPFKNIQTVN